MTWKQLANQPFTQNRKNLEEIKKKSRELKIHVVSSMCNNKYILTLKKNSDGDFKMSGGRFSLSNFGFKSPVYEIEWAADEGNWIEIINIINSGYQRIEKIDSR